MSKDTGDFLQHGRDRQDTEAVCGRQGSPNVTGRLWSRLRAKLKTQVHGPVDEAVEAGAKSHSSDSATFLSDFNAIKAWRMARPDQMFEAASREEDLLWSIKWPDRVAQYKGDLDNYIWRPHGKNPAVMFADLYIATPSSSRLPSALLLFSTMGMLHKFRQHLRSELPLLSSLSATSIELLHVIHAIFRIALRETRDFLQDARQQLFDMTLQSRVHPSKERFQYLLHLNDCRKHAGNYMTGNKELLNEIQRSFRSVVPIDDGSQEAGVLKEPVGEVKEDLEYVERELAKLGDDIGELRKEVLPD
ncbi:MAG: hypothetical protein Q9226_005969 [Calogaya cf. arnoldii]